jgi:hypothetical protein
MKVELCVNLAKLCCPFFFFNLNWCLQRIDVAGKVFVRNDEHSETAKK